MKKHDTSMGFVTGFILVVFLIVCLFLILLVMIQSSKGGMGGVFGGGSQSAFGSSTTDVLTKITRVTAVLFLFLSLVLSYLFAKKENILLPKEETQAEVPASNINSTEEGTEEQTSEPTNTGVVRKPESDNSTNSTKN